LKEKEKVLYNDKKEKRKKKKKKNLFFFMIERVGVIKHLTTLWLNEDNMLNKFSG
jgi:DUF438 domain-containing protein